MNEIHILDSNTIDQIAAGEVVERPSSVVKELVENAIDAGATHITVEIKDGGISLIRVTDDGCGIDRSQLDKVFLRHATSKIVSAEDLDTVMSLGFRGEALSSIAAVCQVELMTKTADALIGCRVCIEGGDMEMPQETGLPDGTTILVKNIFYNTPVRRKFLKTPQTEGSYIADLMQHIALSRPDVAIQFIANGQTKFYTSGNGQLREIIYRIYGKDVAGQLIEVSAQADGLSLSGYLGKPILNRANRAYETFFVNGRYIKSPLLSSAVEEGYKTFLMHHKYPFVVLNMAVDPTRIDVNVHPTKMDIRINDPAKFLAFVKDTVAEALTGKNMVQPMEVSPFTEKENASAQAVQKQLTRQLPQPFEQKRRLETQNTSELQNAKEMPKSQESSGLQRSQDNTAGLLRERSSYAQEKMPDISGVHKILGQSQTQDTVSKLLEQTHRSGNVIKQKETVMLEKPKQMELFEETDAGFANQADDFRIVGQVFDTYWILSLSDKIYFVDQHAAHEKVMYERLMKHYREKDISSQLLNPPVIIHVSPKEKQVLSIHLHDFELLGFEIEEFGEDAYALRAVPMDLYGCMEKELFLSLLDELVSFPVKGDGSAILMKIASMACKAAVKGNSRLSLQEAQALLKELFACENPFNCPHGRPTIISMTRYELEKKFKR